MFDETPKTTENKEVQDALDRAKLAQERREAEQRKRLDELRAHAAAAQAQREKRDEDRRKRQADQRARDDERRQQVESRKRAIWEASVSRRQALLQREQERTERLERARAARSSPRSAFAFGSSTPRLLEPDTGGFFWSARSTIPIDQMKFFEELAASTTNVMFSSTQLSRPASALQLDSENIKDEPDRAPPVWSSVARRRTDLVPTLPAPRAPGRAYSMTRLDKIPSQRTLHSASPSMHHLNRTQTRSGETTPGSRPGSAMSNTTGVVRRNPSAPRKPRPASIAGTGVNTPRGGGDTAALSVATTPSVSRDSTVMAAGDVPRRPQTAPRRQRPVSMHAPPKPATILLPGEGKPPLHRKPKPSKDLDKTNRGISLSASPGRTLSPSPAASKEPSVNRDVPFKHSSPLVDKNQVSAVEVTQKLEALQIQNGETPVIAVSSPAPVVDEKKDTSSEKMDDSDMSASMTAKRITTEEEAKAALAERRRRAREELEKQAELERQRLLREAEEEAERQKQEEERQRREEEEARELARLQRSMEEEKLRKAIEAQQQLEREEADRKAKEELERQARIKEDEEKRKAAEEAERLRKEEAEKEEKERLARKLRVEAIMSRTRLRGAKNEEEKKTTAVQPVAPASEAPSANETPDNGNIAVGELLEFATSQSEESKTPQGNNLTPAAAPVAVPTANNNRGLGEQNNENLHEVSSAAIKFPTLTPESAPMAEKNNGNVQHEESGTNVGHISASFIETERMSAELIDVTAHNGHGTTHNHPLTLQNAI